ncbi:MAG: phosphate ABC transporter substrate-binding protein [Burkholderiales bacterium]|jgi:phosphate transport system substrate-binding protein|nr:phosphate ABC transporter substrate-binding protein [Rubrivivax sp.]
MNSGWRWGQWAVASVVSVAGVGLVGCGRPAADEQRMSVVGSSTIAPLMGEIAKLHEVRHPGTRVDVQTGGSTRGVVDVRTGVAHVGMVSRALKPDEADLQRVLIARDGVGVIVHGSNPVKALSRDQVASVYRGAIRNWRELGGPDLPISVISKAEGRSTLEVFSGYFAVPYKEIKAQLVIGDNQQGIQAVAASPGAIGYVSIGSAEFEARQGTPIRLVAIDGQSASTAAVAAGTYAVVRELNLVFKPDAGPAVQALLATARSADAARVVEAQFFVTTKP